MEASLYFSALVLGICVLHVIWTASGRLDSWWRSLAPHLQTREDRTARRSDWYVFFHCSDLVGEDPVINNKIEESRWVQDSRISRPSRATC